MQLPAQGSHVEKGAVVAYHADGPTWRVRYEGGDEAEIGERELGETLRFVASMPDNEKHKWVGKAVVRFEATTGSRSQHVAVKGDKWRTLAKRYRVDEVALKAFNTGVPKRKRGAIPKGTVVVIPEAPEMVHGHVVDYYVPPAVDGHPRWTLRYEDSTTAHTTANDEINRRVRWAQSRVVQEARSARGAATAGGGATVDAMTDMNGGD